MMKYGNSTVGISAYNVLAARGPANAEDIHVAIEKMQLAGLKMPQLQVALDKLVELGRITLAADGTYALVAGEALFVCSRNESDYDPVTGDGGWRGWLVKDPRIRDGKGSRPLEHLIGSQAPTVEKSE